ncbi:HAD hydrolase-like protein [Caldimonas tepidiphila]|uniref:HAD hydrolase-like protein n=1 Tax=Caldimonas tepidiphila TaxID=2315841 RepID=UPI000E5AE00A|nr:HAD hydrolase-like protein [Caldimonas tepidiphila]
MDKKKYRLALFDFDGTLADSFPFFVGVFNELAVKHGFRQLRPEQLPLMRRLDARRNMELVGMPRWKLPLVAASFIRLMKGQGGEIPLFEGIEETLAHLSERGVTLALVTSNSVDNAVRILGPANAGLFAHREGSMSIFGKRAKILRILARSGIAPAEAIYVGDQISDLQAAREAGVAFGAVAWGYAELDALRRHAPEEVFQTVGELRRIAALR